MDSSAAQSRKGSLLGLLAAAMAVFALGTLWLSPMAVADNAAAAQDVASGWQPADGKVGAQTVAVQLVPAAASVAKDGIFTVDVQIVAGGQSVDGAEVHLDFDPQYLQVVDAGGSPIGQLESGAELDLVLSNAVNNGSGQIDYAAGTLPPTFPSGTFTLATIRFKALWGTGGGTTPLSFVSRGGNRTDVTYQGSSVLANAVNGTVAISGETPLATPTITPTPTRTRTPTLTPPPGRTVYVSLNPTDASVSQSDVFAVNIQIIAGAQPVDGAEIHLDFDPSYLQAVDAAGNPVTSLVAGTELEYVLTNSANNASGALDFAAGTLPPTFPSGTFVLATVHFKALWGTGAGSTPLNFVSRGGNPTNVTYGAGTSVLAGVTHGSVTISGDTPPETATPSATPSRTLTNTPTPTPTQTNTPTSSPTPESTAEIWFRKGSKPSPAYTGVQDTFLDPEFPNKNYGSDARLRLRSDGRFRPIIKFDFSPMTSLGQVVVVDAKLYMWMYEVSNQTPSDANLYRVNRSWAEMSATWTSAASASPWLLVGCDSTPDDRQSDMAATARLRRNSPPMIEWDVTALVQDWVSGGVLNEGLIMIGGGEMYRHIYFYSSDYSDAARRPSLRVLYYVLPPAPTATSTATATPTISPTPTDTPTPTGTQTVAPTHTATPTVTATPTLTLVPGRVDGRAWKDVNGNGLIDGGEAGLPGVVIRCYASDQPAPQPPLATVVSGADGSFAFDALSPGWYVLIRERPLMYISTTRDELSILVASGVSSEARFGSQPISVVLPIIIVHSS